MASMRCARYHAGMGPSAGDPAPDFTLSGVPEGRYRLAEQLGKVAGEYGVRSLLGSARRSIFLIDRAGKVRYRHEDPLSLSYRSVDDILLALRESGLA